MALNLSRSALRRLRGRHYGTLAPVTRTEDMKVLTLGNKIKVVALDNINTSSSIGQVSFYIKAGSRYETPYQQGVTHYLRATALNHAGPFSGFKLTKSIDLAGGNLSVQTTREHTIYTVEGPVYEMADFTKYLGAILTKPKYDTWYRESCEWRVIEDLAKYKANNDQGPNFTKLEWMVCLMKQMHLTGMDVKSEPKVADAGAVAFEELHRAAYRYNLGNSVYCPESMVGSVNSAMLTYFLVDHFRGEDITVVGSGIEQGELERFVEPMETLDEVYEEIMDLLEDPRGRTSFDYSGTEYAIAVPEREEVDIVDMEDIFKIPHLPAKYYGGELRIKNTSPDATFIFAKQGVSYNNERDLLASGILQMILGTGVSIKYGSGGGSHKLSSAVCQATDRKCSATGININYSDSGLFGYAVRGTGYEMRAAVEAANKVFKETLSNIKSSDVEAAKNKLKSAYGYYAENDANLMYEIGTKGRALDLNALFQSIDQISQQDVAKFADKVKASPSTASSAGNIMNTPVLQELE